jgi:hypothetical protein
MTQLPVALQLVAFPLSRCRPHPDDRRQRRQWMPFDMRGTQERRRRGRRQIETAGRRCRASEPRGIDTWA